MTSWPLLGPLFMAAGLSHFSMKEGDEKYVSFPFVRLYITESKRKNVSTDES